MEQLAAAVDAARFDPWAAIFIGATDGEGDTILLFVIPMKIGIQAEPRFAALDVRTRYLGPGLRRDDEQMSSKELGWRIKR